MNRRLVSVLCFALVVASVTSYLVYRLILVRVQSQSQGKTVATSKLLVAKHDLQVGTLLADSDVEEVTWGSPIPEDAVKGRSAIVGRGVIANVFQGEPILARRLAARGAGAGLAATIPMGMRAVALRVNDVVGLAGFVLPGMRVDVLIAGNVPGSTSTMSRTILQNIQVLSAGQKIDKNADGKPETAQVINLLVSPDQAEILNLASDSRVQLVLRNPLDTKPQITSGTSLAKLYGVPEAAASRPGFLLDPPPPNFNRQADTAPTVRPVSVAVKPSTTTVEVFHGAKRTQETFEVKAGSR